MLPTLQQATTDPCLYWRLLDTQAISCGVTVPFSWVLVHMALLCPPRVYFPVLCKFWQLYSGVNGNLLQEDYAIPTPRAPIPAADHCQPYLHRRRSNTVLSQSLWRPWVLVHTRFVWALWASLAERGLILNGNPSLLPSCWGFSFALGRGVSPHSCSSTYRLTG